MKSDDFESRTRFFEVLVCMYFYSAREERLRQLTGLSINHKSNQINQIKYLWLWYSTEPRVCEQPVFTAQLNFSCTTKP